MLGKLLGPDIQELLEEKRLIELRQALEEFPPYDIAELIADIAPEQRGIVFRILPRTLASDVFEKMTLDAQRDLLELLGQEQSRHIIEEMDPDDRTALLEELPARVTRQLLRLLSPEEREIAQALLAYPEESVGRIMTPDYIDLRADMTAREAVDFIRRVGMDKETVYVCYVTGVGQIHELQGVVGLRRLVVAPGETLVEDLMDEPSAVVHTNDDRITAAHALRDYDLLALPVVDSDRRLVGIVTVDDVLDIVEEEASEDIQVMAGLLPETEHSYLNQHILGIGWRRGAPLMGLVLGQFVAGLVLASFHKTLGAITALAFFIPLVMATGGSTGIQTATLIARGLSTGEMRLGDFRRLLAREMGVCLLLSLVMATVAIGLGYLMVHSKQESGKVSFPISQIDIDEFQKAIDRNETIPITLEIEHAKKLDASRVANNEESILHGVGNLALKIAMTIGCTMILVMFLSVTAGVILPMLFEAMKLDPAVMTSPFLTTTVDVLGLLIYFIVASRIIGL